MTAVPDMRLLQAAPADSPNKGFKPHQCHKWCSCNRHRCPLVTKNASHHNKAAAPINRSEARWQSAVSTIPFTEIPQTSPWAGNNPWHRQEQHAPNGSVLPVLTTFARSRLGIFSESWAGGASRCAAHALRCSSGVGRRLGLVAPRFHRWDFSLGPRTELHLHSEPLLGQGDASRFFYMKGLALGIKPHEALLTRRGKGSNSQHLQFCHECHSRQRCFHGRDCGYRSDGPGLHSDAEVGLFMD